ncbi:MAG: helix-turn-helix domain-containing protein [Myxococcota bacterium]
MRKGQTIDREVRALGALVRMGDEKAIRRVVAALDKHNGWMIEAAAELGISGRTIHLWAKEVPEIAAHSRGREWQPPSEKEIARIIATLKKHDGKVTYTAESLGISIRTLYRIMDELPEVAKHAGGTGLRRTRRGKAK